MSEKTEEATPQRLRKARADGDSGSSAVAAQAVAFVVAAALAPAAVRALAERAAIELHRVVVQGGDARALALAFDPAKVVGDVLAPALPLLFAVGAAGALGHLVQTGGVFSTRRLVPRFERLNPASGIKGLVSASRLFAVVRSLAGGAAVAYLTYGVIREGILDMARTVARPPWVGLVSSTTAGRLLVRAALVGLVLAVGDVLITRSAWKRRLRMTRDEVRREHRDAEADPQVKAARERAHHAMLEQATIANVKTATVVIVNPTHVACALRYDDARGDEAPVVVAVGEGDFAARIVRAARDLGIPVLQDVPLAHALHALRTGDAIPEALYEAVAAILQAVRSSG